jgi:membrane protease subunit HflK
MNWDWEKLQKQNKGQGGAPPPQFDEVLEKLKNIKFSGGPVLIITIIAALLIASTTFYTVGLDEVGIVQRFGKYSRTTNPGLNFKLPIGIEKVTKVKVKKVFKEEFGFRSIRTEQSKFTSDKGNIDESLMLTGDLNVAVAPWIVQYKIKDPYNYLFKVNRVNDLLRDLAESSMRLVVGDRSINEVISRRQEIADEGVLLLQAELNEAETGIKVVTIEMKKTNVPDPVQPSFNEVNQAVQEREQTIYEAKRDYNKAIPAAKGEADRTIKKAEGYSVDLTNRAEGDASRFKALYAEYSKAKDITKRRIYLEKMTELFPKLGKKFIIDSDQKNVLPLLNLGKENGVLK